MIGCFAGVIILNLYRPDSKNSDDFKYFKYGMMCALSFVICGAMVSVLNRKMKSVHFSIIQFDYAFVAWVCMLVTILTEYVFLHGDKMRYPYPTLRILTYRTDQWVVMITYALSNFFVQLFFNIGSTRGKSAFVSLVAQIGVVWSFLADFIILGNPIQSMQIVGALIIVVFNVFAILI